MFSPCSCEFRSFAGERATAPEALIQVALMFSVCLARNQSARAFKAAHRRMKLIHRQDFFSKSMQMAYKPKRRKTPSGFGVLNSASP
jgi:hypothetical protein